MRIHHTIPAISAVLAIATIARAQTLPAAEEPSVIPPSTQPIFSSNGTVVRGFRFIGNTRLTDSDLQKVVAKYAGRTLTPEQLEAACQDVTRRLIDAGFINSGAVLPDQTIADGIVTMRIVEGRLGDVNVTFKDSQGRPTEHHLLRKSFIADRIHFATDPPPLDLLKLKDELELLRQNPNIGAINAELKPGDRPGDSRLDVQTLENNPIQVGFQWSNRRNPSVGSTAYDVLVADSDVTGNGDAFHVQYDIANGSIGDPQLAGADDFSLDYAIPISPADTTLAINFTRTNALVTEAPFTDLNIGSKTDSTSFTIRQPIYRKPVAEAATPSGPGSPSVEFDLLFTGALRDNTTSLLGRGFSFSPGQNDGSGRATVLRFGQELVTRGQNDALSARSTFNLGVPWFGATPNVNRSEAGGKFFAWLGQTQYIHLIGKSDWQLVLRSALQLSDRPLLPVEQFSLGGIDSVRGYPENFLVRDQGISGAIELHIPVIHGKSGNPDVLTLVPFIDGGYGWNRNHASAPAQAIDSVGLGLLFAPNQHFNAQIYYGVPLKDHSQSRQDPEDLGLHFSLLFLAY